MQENESLSQTRTGTLTPEVNLTVSSQRICTRRAGNGSLGSEILGVRGSVKAASQGRICCLLPLGILSGQLQGVL